MASVLAIACMLCRVGAGCTPPLLSLLRSPVSVQVVATASAIGSLFISLMIGIMIYSVSFLENSLECNFLTNFPCFRALLATMLGG